MRLSFALEFDRELACVLVEHLAHSDERLTQLVRLALHIRKELLGHRDERVVGPCREPVDGTAVDERWEL